VNLVLIDLRRTPGQEDFEARVAKARQLLDALDDVDDIEARYGFHRIVVLVSAADGDPVDPLLMELGGYGVRHVLKEAAPGDGGDETFTRRVLETSVRLMFDRQPSKTALCAAGGGTTGVYFEVGALKCLDDCLSEGALHSFDMYFGISAGAVVNGVLAAGYSVDELMAAVAGVEGGRIAPLNLALLRLGHINVPDVGRRLKEAASSTVRAAIDIALLRGRPSLDDVFLDTTALVGAPFRSDRFEDLLRDLLTRPGATNDFRKLPYGLYVGASDQDARRHVLFGSEGHSHIPISQAIQASLSVNPAFASVPIEGHWYEDGAVTRTSNLMEAIRRNADLVIVVDPFVPYVSRTPGSASRRGVLYNIDQDIRALSYTRFENTRSWLLRRHPEVSSYTFLPNNRLRRLLSVNPMDHRPYLEIWRGAYLGTLARVRRLRHRMAGDLAVHGIGIDTERAEAVAQRLEATPKPELSDFFPDGRIALRTPPLALERQVSA
jgi:predicted acylesterase/phospholipase RssA